jgi:glycosyltransferase involved in cell wall biosynthesis
VYSPRSGWTNGSRRQRVDRVLFLTHEPLTSSLAGPGIRVWELAHVLARQQPVTIGTPNKSPLRSASLEVRSYRDSAMAQLVSEHPIVIAFGYLLAQHPVIRRNAEYLVMDLYDPFLLENLLMHDDLPMERRQAVHRHDLDVVVDQLRLADFFLCASERQRDYWLGALSTVNRINPRSYAQDPSLRKLIDVVPFGLPTESPKRGGPGLRAETPGIGPDDVVLLWGGGIWNWFDPLTAIRAVAAVREELPELKLYFMGLRHPNPDLPQMDMARRAVGLASELGLLDRSVFFRDGWVPYERRADYLGDADLGISLHRESIETRFSFRTRFLDYLWAGLPTIATAGDVLSDELALGGAAITVPEGDVSAVVAALRTLVRDRQRRSGMRQQALRLAREHDWERAAEPLLAFCRAPYRNQPGRSPDGTLFFALQLGAVWRRSWMRKGARSIGRRLKRQTRIT